MVSASAGLRHRDAIVFSLQRYRAGRNQTAVPRLGFRDGAAGPLTPPPQTSTVGEPDSFAFGGFKFQSFKFQDKTAPPTKFDANPVNDRLET